MSRSGIDNVNGSLRRERITAFPAEARKGGDVQTWEIRRIYRKDLVNWTLSDPSWCTQLDRIDRENHVVEIGAIVFLFVLVPGPDPRSSSFPGSSANTYRYIHIYRYMDRANPGTGYGHWCNRDVPQLGIGELIAFSCAISCSMRRSYPRKPWKMSWNRNDLEMSWRIRKLRMYFYTWWACLADFRCAF